MIDSDLLYLYLVGMCLARTLQLTQHFVLFVLIIWLMYYLFFDK